jgi:hypothetical protein
VALSIVVVVVVVNEDDGNKPEIIKSIMPLH